MSTPIDADARSVAGMAAELAKLQRRIDQLELGANTNQLGQSSLEDGSMTVYDANGNPRSIIGKQDDGSYVGGRSVNNPTPPIVPNPPTVVPGFGTLKVETHGPSNGKWMWDYSHTNIWLAKGIPGDGTPLEAGVVVGNVIGLNPSAFVIAGLSPTGYRVWLTSVNQSGTESDYSTAVQATPTVVVGTDILDGAVTTLKLAAEAVTAANIAAGAVGSIQIGEQVVDLEHLAANSVGGEQLIAGAIAAGHLGAGSVTALAIAANAIQAVNIAAGAIQAGAIDAGAVTAEKILALAITGDKIAANAVTAGAIAAGAITADKIRAGEVLADISIQTGTSGRRILLSGPDNEIRFFPALSETKFARLFSYQPLDFPDDVNLEIRAINSVQTNVTPRLVMAPDDIFLGLTDAASDAVGRGGRVRLSEDSGQFGITTIAGAETGLFCWDTGELDMRGWWANYTQPYTNAAIWVMNISVIAGASAVTGVSLDYGITMSTTMAPMLSHGILTSAEPMYSIRDEGNSLTGMGIRFGLNNNGASPAAVGMAPALPASKTMKIRAWVFRTLTELSMPL
jgi:hypothetical protein